MKQNWERRQGSANSLRGPKQNAARRPQKKKKPPSLKNQIRAIERLLKKDYLDIRIRKKEEAKLKELSEAAKAHRAQELERKYAVRYHKIRFFERVKIERRIKQFSREFQSADPASAAHNDLQAKLAQATRDLQYVVHFPKGEKYVSLLRNAEDSEAQRVLEAERARIRAKVQQQLADEAMITQADEGRPQSLQQPANEQAALKAQQGVTKARDQKARGEANGGAASGKEGPKRRMAAAEQPAPPPSKRSRGPSKGAERDVGNKPAQLLESQGREGGSTATDGQKQSSDALAAPAEVDDFEEDDFFMGSSADEADAGGKQPPQAVRPPDTAAVPLHEDIPSSEDSEASKPMLLKQSQQRQRNRSSARPPGKAHAARSGKPHGKNSIAPVHKTVKLIHSGMGGPEFGSHGKPSLAVAGKPDVHKLKAAGKGGARGKPSPGAAPVDPPGQPLRTRAEGGRKRRTKKR